MIIFKKREIILHLRGIININVPTGLNENSINQRNDSINISHAHKDR